MADDKHDHNRNVQLAADCIIFADGMKTDAPLHEAMLDNPQAEHLADVVAANIAEELGFPEIAQAIRRR